MTPIPGQPRPSDPIARSDDRVASSAPPSPALDRLSPRAAVAAWLVSDPAPEVAFALATSIRRDARIELEPEEIGGVIADARAEGLDPDLTFDRLILQGEWLSLNRLARIRPR